MPPRPWAWSAAHDTTQAVGAIGALPGEEEPADEDDQQPHPHLRHHPGHPAGALLVAGFFLLRNLGYLGGSSSFNLSPVAGETVVVATNKLTADGLVVKIQDQTSTQTPGIVLSTDPPANSLVKKGDTVTLKVAVAPNVHKVAVPSGLTDISVADAQSMLQGQGLTGTVVTKSSSSVQKGFVISTSPGSGTKVPLGSSVTLTVSSGQANAPVPSVIGFSEAQAGAQLDAAGFIVGGVNPVPSSQYPTPGTVIATNPGPGASVPPGTTVNLQVSSGPPPTTTTTSTSSTTTTTTNPNSSTTSSTSGGGGATRRGHAPH